MFMTRTPCVGVCKQNLRVDMCTGCFRTTQEKCRWNFMSDEERLATLKLCKLRSRKYKGMQAGDVAPIEGV